MPTSPRGWLCWAVSVSDRYGRPHSPRYEYDGYSDHRLNDRRETAISVKILAERASRECTSNGVGYALLSQFYVEEASWYSFTENERWILNRTIRRFRRELQAAGFLPDTKDEEEGDRGV